MVWCMGFLVTDMSMSDKNEEWVRGLGKAKYEYEVSVGSMSPIFERLILGSHFEFIWYLGPELQANEHFKWSFGSNSGVNQIWANIMHISMTLYKRMSGMEARHMCIWKSGRFLFEIRIYLYGLSKNEKLWKKAWQYLKNSHNDQRLTRHFHHYKWCEGCDMWMTCELQSRI